MRKWAYTMFKHSEVMEMPLWLRKIVVALITVFTLGLVTPPANFLANVSGSTSKANLVNSNSEDATKDTIQNVTLSVEQSNTEPNYRLPWPEVAAGLESEENIDTYFMDYSKYHVNQQAMTKFGERISSKIGEQFTNEISPKIYEAIELFTKEVSEDSIPHLTITEKPSSGYGEKIFHIYDVRDGADRFRVHVRREHPPQNGYWFSFHYHTISDQFQAHHDLGKIFWDNNTPPKWMA
jgi:hypothetical protein